ncbi:MAG: hypothetical protein AAF585_17235, partial [Verrucomicrobiota bacterium]
MREQRTAETNHGEKKESEFDDHREITERKEPIFLDVRVADCRLRFWRMLRIHIILGLLVFLVSHTFAEVKIDQSSDTQIALSWPTGNETETAELRLRFAEGQPVFESIGVTGSEAILTNVDPAFILTLGQRDLKKRNGWTIFFDRVPTRPYESHVAKFEPKAAPTIERKADRVTVRASGVTAGPFSGELAITVFSESQLIKVEAIVETDQDATALVFDAGLTSAEPNWNETAWMNNQDQWKRQNADSSAAAESLAVRRRTVIAESDTGSVAILAEPHRYFYPLDFANNFGFTWAGVGYRDVVPEYGFGIRQPLKGDERFVPWFNAPPKTKQRLSFFLLVSPDTAESAFEDVSRYTRNDQFKPLDGHVTFTSHYHVEHSLEYIRRQEDQKTDGIPEGLESPGFVKTFRDMGVDIVHLAEFHNGRTPRMKAPQRLRQLSLMHRECRRLSDDEFLLLPGEEPNVHLGGHWISFFPKPVYWVLNRDKDHPFIEEHPKHGTVYHVGNTDDVLELMKRENGLMWTAHARIKSSTGFPDLHRHRDFFRSDHFLGAAWKAMPADLSHDRLGIRILDLQDDMANWKTAPKYMLGEVDVFKVEPDYELYGHMNINYLKLDAIPRYD